MNTTRNGERRSVKRRPNAGSRSRNGERFIARPADSSNQAEDRGHDFLRR